MYIHTAWDFLEMSEFAVSVHSTTSGNVSVEVTFSQPRVVISGETGRGDGTSLHTRLERFEFSKSLGTSGDVKSLVDGDDLF